jgi:hypothetical protein
MLRLYPNLEKCDLSFIYTMEPHHPLPSRRSLLLDPKLRPETD